LQEEKLDGNPKEKGNGRQRKPTTATNPFKTLPASKNKTHQNFFENHHSLHETFSFTDIPCKDPCCKGTKNFPSNDLFSLSLSLSLSLCLLMDRSLDRAVAAEDCRGRTTATIAAAESKEEAKAKGGGGPNSFTAADF